MDLSERRKIKKIPGIRAYNRYVRTFTYLHQPRQRKTKTIRLATLATPTPTSRNHIADQVRLPGFGWVSAPLPPVSKLWNPDLSYLALRLVSSRLQVIVV